MSVSLLLAAAGIVWAIFAWPFLTRPATMPYGVDTAGYVWRAEATATFGIDRLPALGVGSEVKALGDRPGYPVLLSVLGAVVDRPALTLAWLTPAVMAVCLGLGIATLVGDGLGEGPLWRAGAAVGVAGSAFVAWTAVGYAANLAIDVLAAGAIALVILEVRGSGHGPAIALLLAAAAATHWMFAIVLVGVLIGAVLVVAILARISPSVRAEHGSVLHPIGWVFAGVCLGAVLLAVAPQRPGGPSVPAGTPNTVARLPSFDLAVTLPIAVGSALLLLWLGRPRERGGAVALLGWALVAPAGLLAWYVLHLPVPPGRSAGFALGIPALITLGGRALAVIVPERVRASARGPVHLAAVLAGLAAVLMLAAAGARVWSGSEPKMTTREMGQLGTATSYLRALPSDETIAFVTAQAPTVLVRIRAGLPAPRYPFVVVDRIRGSQDDGPVAADVVLYLTAYNRRPPPATALVLGPGVYLLRGPRPTAAVQPGTEPRAPSLPAMVALSLALLLTLGAAGSGWAFALPGASAAGRFGVAPALGIAAITAVCYPLDLLGVRMRMPGALIGTAAAAALGWTLVAVHRRRADQRSGSSLAAPEPPAHDTPEPRDQEDPAWRST